MRRLREAIVKATAVALVAMLGCGSTGGNLVSFDVAAGGPAEGVPPFDTGLGWHVILHTAKLHVGAIYLNLAVPISGAQSTSCILPGIYTAEELSGLDIDLLARDAQPFPAGGNGTDDTAKTGEVWLVGGDVNAPTDVNPLTGQSTVVAELAGTASNSLFGITFSATITIGQNRAIASTDPSMPGAHPICKQRIVTPIPIQLAPHDGGTLILRVDPARWFANVDFSELSPPDYVFPDDLSIAASQNLFNGLRGPASYDLSFK
jgi:hypothetical protein